MNIEPTLVEQSSGEQSRSDEANAHSNSSDRTTAYYTTKNRNEIGSILKRWKIRFSSLNRCTMGILVFALFTSIAILIGVLTVYFNSSKTNTTCQLSFKRTNKSSISRDSQPRSVAVGDLNNDKRIDIIVANSGTNTIGIFLSYADGTFSNQTTYSAGSQSQPYSIVVDHFNNDTNLDIAVANYGANNIGIFFGHGNGSFHDQKVFPIGSSRPFFITSGDLNNDNRTDIVVANYGTANIGILFGYSNGSFQPPTTYSTGYDSLPYSLAVGDFNKDKFLDIAVANYGTNNIGIFLGDSNSTFANQKIFPTGRNSNPSSVAAADFNNDNQPDIVVANYGASNVGILLGYSNGTFAAQKTYPILRTSRPNYITVGYFDKDNQLDIVIVDSENDQVHILPGYGNGTFATVTTYDTVSDSRPFSVAVTDFGNDNQSDIVVANYGTNNILLLTGYSSKPSAKSTNYFVGRDSRPTSVAINDFNNDNHMDIVVNNLNNDNVLILIGYGNGSFDKGEAYSAGNRSAPKRICIGDLNNDRRMDIVTANSGSDSVGILLGQDNGTFATVTTYSTGVGSSPWCVVLGDVNNDNQLDIVSVTSNNGSILVLLGHGNGTFANAAMFPAALSGTVYTVAMGDINSDRRLDIVIGYFNYGSVSVFLGYGNGTFKTPMNIRTGSGSSLISIALADLNRDSHLDMVRCGIYTNNVGVLLGYGNGTFKTEKIYSTGNDSQPYSVIVIDFNNDNYYDIAVTNFGNDQIVIFFGDGNGSFELVRTFSTGSDSGPYGIAFGNLNNNNQSQLVVTYWGTSNVGVLTEYYAALFDNQITYSTGSTPNPYSVAIDDFNSDHQFDIVVANSGTDNIGILLNLGNSTFGTQMTYSIGMDSAPQYLITGDINKDSHADIITVNSKDDSISLFMGYGNGTFADQKKYSIGSGSHPSAIALGDFNNDNRSDIVIANKDKGSAGLLLGFEYASLRSQNIYTSAGNLGPWGMIVSDFNNDSYLDIAVTFWGSGNVDILLGYSNGSFATMLTFTTGVNSHPICIVVGDFNNDGQSDIAVGNSIPAYVCIFLGYGNGSFSSMITAATEYGSQAQGLDVGDFNHDNRLDIAVANQNNNNVGILLGYGNGSFAIMVPYSTGTGSQPYAVAVNDLNNDGRQDIVAVNYGISSISIFLGYGNGSFEKQRIYSTGSQSLPWWVSLGDFNGDHRLDIATANWGSNNVGIFLGYGNGSFTAVITYSTGDGSTPRFTSVGDFNNDSRLDIAVANFGTNTVVILFGFGDGTFLLGTSYSTGSGSRPQTLASGDFNNDGRLDIAVGNQLSSDIRIFLGYGSEPFAGVTTFTTGDGSQPQAVAIGDFNIDGCADIVVANYGTNSVGVLLASGNGGFNTMISYSTGVGSAPYSVAVGDFNSDHRSDIVVTNSGTDNVAIFLGFGNGTFATAAIYSTGDRSRPYTVTIADFNNDNRSDIAVVNSGTSSIFLLYGSENGAFGNQTSYALGYGYLPYGIAVKDLNQDGWMDIVIACYGTDHVEILIKMC